MDGERWSAVILLVWFVIITALFDYLLVSASIRDLRWKLSDDNRALRSEIGDLRRDVGAVQREIESHREQNDREVEQIRYELRRIR